MVLRCAQLRTVQRQPRVRVVWVQADGFCVLDDRDVVVPALLGVATAAQRAGAGAAGGKEAEGECRGDAAAAKFRDGMKR